MPKNIENTENNTNIELRSEEVQEILGHIPSWIVRWGITLFFFILIAILAGSYFFSYPDVVQGEIEILSENPPVEIRSKVSGQIDSLLVSDNQDVDKGDIVAIVKNPASYTDICYTKKFATDLSGQTGTLGWPLVEIPTYIPSLGNVQSQWAGLISVLKEYREFLAEKYYDKKIVHLAEKTTQQQQYNKNLKSQIALAQQSLALTESQFNKDSILFTRGVIAEAEFDRSKQQVIQQKQSLQGQKASLTQSAMQLTNLTDQLTDYQNAKQTEIKRMERAIGQQLEAFISAIGVWEENYLIVAPKSGKVSFTGIWSAKQPVMHAIYNK